MLWGRHPACRAGGRGTTTAEPPDNICFNRYIDRYRGRAGKNCGYDSIAHPTAMLVLVTIHLVCNPMVGEADIPALQAHPEASFRRVPTRQAGCLPHNSRHPSALY
jgi:hypothetical protein